MKNYRIANNKFYGKMDFDANLMQNMEILRDLHLYPEICIIDSTYLYEKFQPIGNQLHAILTGSDLQASFHLPFYGLQLGCKDSYIRKLSFDLIMKGLHRAAELGISSAVMHVSLPSHIPDRGREKWLQSFNDNLSRILSYCQNERITLHLENTYEPDPEVFLKILEIFDSDYLAVCLDVAHTYCYSEVAWREWWNALGHKAGIIHLSDNETEQDSHQALGTGKIDFHEVFDLALSRDIRFTIETDVHCFKRSLEFIAKIIPGFKIEGIPALAES